MTNSISNDYTDLGLTRPEQPDNERRTELGQEDFLALLSTQLQNQDPFSPMENEQFIAQMAQFSSVDSLQRLETSMGDLASSLTSNQALQASALVGRSVTVPSQYAYLPEEGSFTGQVNLPQTAQNVFVEIKDGAGQVLQRLELGTLPEGAVRFEWNGEINGNRFPSGTYEIAAYGQVNGQTEQLGTSARAQVDSVNLGGGLNGIQLNLTGLGTVSLNDVSEIGRG